MKQPLWKTLAHILEVNNGRVDQEDEESERVQTQLCVSGIYDSNIKYKYSTVTLGVAVWQKRESCIVLL